jgi:hypothetical protein
VNQYERAKHLPNPSVLEKLGKVLNCPLALFFAVDDGLAALTLAYHRASAATQAITSLNQSHSAPPCRLVGLIAGRAAIGHLRSHAVDCMAPMTCRSRDEIANVSGRP